MPALVRSASLDNNLVIKRCKPPFHLLFTLFFFIFLPIVRLPPIFLRVRCGNCASLDWAPCRASLLLTKPFVSGSGWAGRAPRMGWRAGAALVLVLGAAAQRREGEWRLVTRD